MRESILDCTHRSTALLCLPFLITSLCRSSVVPEATTDRLVKGRGWTDKNIISLMELTVATPISSVNPNAAPAESSEEPNTEPAAAAAPTDTSTQILAAIQRVEDRQLGLMTFIRDFANSTVNFINHTLNYPNVVFPTFPAHYFTIPSPTPTPTPAATPHQSAASTPSPAPTAAGSPQADTSA
ncbi:hypothetical protein HRI_001361400 [Hibiscus trionum]|uniref:Uncharacterized protein n=1 Tax=Hibiscus trionum TaxID=183268 RepID=A0A9W7HGD6_HIBTR|nr:hypothetical protein HRI_001361400 [Hibiscus trionum]